MAWGDYDNDGLLDFASTAGVFHNAGSSFEQLPVSIPSAETVLWADVNNDVITSVLACNMVNCIIWHSGTSYLESNQYNWSAIEGLYTPSTDNTSSGNRVDSPPSPRDGRC